MTDNRNRINKTRELPFFGALIPIIVLFGLLATLIVSSRADAIADYAPFVLLIAASTGLIVSYRFGTLRRRNMKVGFRRASSQILPAIPLLFLIALLAGTWMLSGVVPAMVTYGMKFLDPHWFLIASCLICAVVSVMTGSSWSTIATVGVAFIGIGEMMGYSSGWTAGAVISGAYFGDKISPLSDTTVIASSTCEVDILTHIRYMLITTLPALIIALVVFWIKGHFGESITQTEFSGLSTTLENKFNLSPWLLVIPLLTVVMIALRVSALLTLGISSLAGIFTAMLYQPNLISGETLLIRIGEIADYLIFGFNMETGDLMTDTLVSTGGVVGILSVVFLVLSALVFGWVMMGTGILSVLTERITRRLRRPASIVGASIASGFTLGACTADQYLSIILGGNIYRELYRKQRLEKRLLSRSLEDSVSATSPLIPWSSCGVTQSAVLGVSTLAYLPYCIFNYTTPLIGLAVASLGWGIRRTDKI